MHPLSPDLSKLNTEELHQKYNDLQKRLQQSMQFGNHGMISQLQLLLSDYQYEMNVRNRKQLEEIFKDNPSFSKIIDIK
jgi:predicted Zn-dependent protease